MAEGSARRIANGPSQDGDDNFYDPAKRGLEKQASRDQDAADIASGRITFEEVRRCKSFFPADWCRNAIIMEWKKFN